jgi:hypothetical protein
MKKLEVNNESIWKRKLYLLITLIFLLAFSFINTLTFTLKRLNSIAYLMLVIVGIPIVLYFYLKKRSYFKILMYIIVIFSIPLSLGYMWLSRDMIGYLVNGLAPINLFYIFSLYGLYLSCLLSGLVLFYVSKNKLFYQIIMIVGVIAIILGIAIFIMFPTFLNVLNCNQSKTPLDKDSCLLGKASGLKDISYCEQIVDTSIKYLCLALLKDDTSYCQKMETMDKTNYCLAVVNKDRSLCISLPDNLRTPCLTATNPQSVY